MSKVGLQFTFALIPAARGAPPSMVCAAMPGIEGLTEGSIGITKAKDNCLWQGSKRKELPLPGRFFVICPSAVPVRLAEHDAGHGNQAATNPCG